MAKRASEKGVWIIESRFNVDNQKMVSPVSMPLNFEKIRGTEEEVMIFNSERYKDHPNEMDLTKQK